MDPEEQNPSPAPISGISHEKDPLHDFLVGDSSLSEAQHFAEPVKDWKMDHESPNQQNKDILDTQSFLHHESQPHHVPAAGDSFQDMLSGYSAPSEKKLGSDFGSGHDDFTFGERSSPEKPKPTSGDLYDFSNQHSAPPPPQPAHTFGGLDDFLSTPAPPRDPSPDSWREPTPEPLARDYSPEPIRKPSPDPIIREPSPEPVREPSPEPPKAPVLEPTPPPKVLPAPPLVTKSEKVPEKIEPRKEPSKPTSPPPAPPKRVTSSESKSCEYGIAAWFQPERLHPKVEALVYWRDPKKSGAVFGSIMVVLLSLSWFSLISVIANLSLVVLCATFGFRIYKTIMHAIQKTSDGHPFKEILEADVALPQERVRQTSDVAVAHINATIAELRRLFLVEDFIDSLKFGVALWALTYVGSWFNGMTLIILGVVALFTLPKVYETNKAQIDQHIDLVRSKINDITAKVKAAIPIGKKAEEKKEQ